MRRSELARELGISQNTLRVHLMRMRAKLEVTERGDAAFARAVAAAIDEARPLDPPTGSLTRRRIDTASHESAVRGI